MPEQPDRPAELIRLRGKDRLQVHQRLPARRLDAELRCRHRDLLERRQYIGCCHLPSRRRLLGLEALLAEDLLATIRIDRPDSPQAALVVLSALHLVAAAVEAVVLPAFSANAYGLIGVRHCRVSDEHCSPTTLASRSRLRDTARLRERRWLPTRRTQSNCQPTRHRHRAPPLTGPKRTSWQRASLLIRRVSVQPSCQAPPLQFIRAVHVALILGVRISSESADSRDSAAPCKMRRDDCSLPVGQVADRHCLEHAPAIAPIEPSGRMEMRSSRPRSPEQTAQLRRLRARSSDVSLLLIASERRASSALRKRPHPCPT